MEGPSGPGPFYPSGRSSAYVSGGTFASAADAPQNPFADPVGRPGSPLGAGAAIAGLGAVGAGAAAAARTKETGGPSTPRRVTPIQSRPNTARSSFLAAPSTQGTPSRGGGGGMSTRGGASFEGSRSSKFTEDIV